MFLILLIGSGNSLSVSKKALLKTQATNQCFSPQNGVINGGPWSNQGAQNIQNSVSFQAYGNDIYVGFFDNASSTSFNYAFIICGWGNAQTKFYSANDFDDPLAEINNTIDPTALNSFEIDFIPSSGTINLTINGNQVFSYSDPSFQDGEYSYVRFSQYSSNVQICVGCFDPQNGVIGNGPWGQNGLRFTGILNLNALGNDIYIGFFPDSDHSTNNSDLLYAIIMAGFGDAETQFFSAGGFNNVLASGSSYVDPTVENMYNITFDDINHSITLTINGTVIFSFEDPNYVGNQVNWVNFSQYSVNVAICNPTTGRGAGRCGH